MESKPELIISEDPTSCSFEVDIVFCGADITLYASESLESYASEARMLAVKTVLRGEIERLTEAFIEDGEEDGCLAVPVFHETVNVPAIEFLDRDPQDQIQYIRGVLIAALDSEAELAISGFEVSEF
jgi:hypothetical protein